MGGEHDLSHGLAVRSTAVILSNTDTTDIDAFASMVGEPLIDCDEKTNGIDAGVRKRTHFE